MNRLALALPLVLAILLLSAACDNNDEATPAAGVDSPAPPGQAPAEFIALSAASLVTGDVGGEEPAVTTTVQECEGTARSINLEDPAGSGSYRFDPSQLTFKVGECVNFTLTPETEFHTFTVDELGLDVEANGGETVTFSFEFDAAGTFELICIPHQFLGMVGTIAVSP